MLQQISRSIEMPNKYFKEEINECPCCIVKASQQGINLFSTIAHIASNIESYSNSLFKLLEVIFSLDHIKL